jgi:predicted flap endonuclease-1-like 5' DNA nuclease
MIYLLTLGWPWFAGAATLGALVGFVTFSREKHAIFSGGWIVASGGLALGAGGAVSFSETLVGRDAVAFDVALLAGLFYAVGLPFGGALKAVAGPEAERKRVAAAPITALSETALAEAPLVLPQDPVEAPPMAQIGETEVADEADGGIEILAPALAPVTAAPLTPAAAAPRAKRLPPGLRPETLKSPRNGAPDDLSRIKGIGPKSLEKLNAIGVFHYDQIAAWNLDNARWIGATIGAPGRVERDKWIQQARGLVGVGAEQ